MRIAALSAESTATSPHEVLAQFSLVFLISEESLLNLDLGPLLVVGALPIGFAQRELSQDGLDFGQEFMQDLIAHRL